MNKLIFGNFFGFVKNWVKFVNSKYLFWFFLNIFYYKFYKKFIINGRNNVGINLFFCLCTIVKFLFIKQFYLFFFWLSNLLIQNLEIISIKKSGKNVFLPVFVRSYMRQYTLGIHKLFLHFWNEKKNNIMLFYILIIDLINFVFFKYNNRLLKYLISLHALSYTFRANFHYRWSNKNSIFSDLTVLNLTLFTKWYNH